MALKQSFHYKMERRRREKLIQEIGEGTIVSSMIEYSEQSSLTKTYLISDTGIITVVNYSTKKIVTRFIARPNQIKKYYNGEPPQYLLQIALEHKRHKLNSL